MQIITAILIHAAQVSRGSFLENRKFWIYCAPSWRDFLLWLGIFPQQGGRSSLTLITAFCTWGRVWPALSRCFFLFITNIQNFLQNTSRCRQWLSNRPGLGCSMGERAQSLLPVLCILLKPGKVYTEAHHTAPSSNSTEGKGPSHRDEFLSGRSCHWNTGPHIPPRGNEAPRTQTCAHNTVSSGSSKAFGSCPVFSGTVQLGMPSPVPEQEKQVVDGHSLPDLDVSDADLTLRAVPKQWLGPSGESTDMEGTSAGRNKCSLNNCINARVK